MKQNKYTTSKLFIEVIKVAPVSFFMQYMFSIISGIMMGKFTIQMQVVFDNVEDFVLSKNTINTVLISIVILGLIKVISEGTSVISNYLGGKYYHLASEHFMNIYNLKHEKINPIYYEDEKKLNIFRKSLDGTTVVRNQFHLIMDILTLYIPYFLVISKYIFDIKPLLLWIILIMFFPVILSNRLKKKLYAKLEDETSNLLREKDTYFDYMTKYEYIKETRSLIKFDYFKKIFIQSREEYNNKQVSALKKNFQIESLSKLITMSGYLIAILLLIISIMNKEISIGVFGAIFFALDDIYLFLDELFIRRLGQYVRNQPKVTNLIAFLNMEEIEKNTEKDIEFKEIMFDNISFKYPNTDTNAIDNISFSIKKNEKIGIVGLNGSGKSTLSKILLGLYKPNEGDIYIDGEKVKSNKYFLFPAIAVFQNFNKYKISIKDNVALSESDIKAKEEDIYNLLNRIGIDINKKKLENGIDTLCGKEFGGIDFSGGEWQKIAIARGLYRDRNLIVLDEPTAAIDPIQEYEIYKLFEEISQDKTAIIITHSLMSIKFCDRIIVMENGRIIDNGSHETLINRCKLYQELWNSKQNKVVCEV